MKKAFSPFFLSSTFDLPLFISRVQSKTTHSVFIMSRSLLYNFFCYRGGIPNDSIGPYFITRDTHAHATLDFSRNSIRRTRAQIHTHTYTPRVMTKTTVESDKKRERKEETKRRVLPLCEHKSLSIKKACNKKSPFFSLSCFKTYKLRGLLVHTYTNPLAHLVLCLASRLPVHILGLELVGDGDVQVAVVLLAGLILQNTADCLAFFDSQDVLKVEDSLFPVRVLCVRAGGEADGLMAGGKLNVEPGNDGVDKVVAAYLELVR